MAMLDHVITSVISTIPFRFTCLSPILFALHAAILYNAVATFMRLVIENARYFHLIDDITRFTVIAGRIDDITRFTVIAGRIVFSH